MAIYLTGDTHNYYDIGKLQAGGFNEDGLTRDDYLIILGDFGFVWSPESEFEYWKEDQDWLDWLEERPYTTLWIDGNHENFDLLEQYPVDTWHGGQVHFIRDHVIHLMRGQIFSLDGRSFFTMGGAYSIDKDVRTPHMSWWPQEVPTAQERAAAEAVLQAADWKVDYVLTHEAPSRTIREIDPDEPYILQPNEYSDWLQTIADKLTFKRWFHGHHHVDRWWDKRFTGLYQEVFDLDDTGRTPFGSSTDMFEVD